MPKFEDGDSLIPRSEAMKILGVSDSTLRRLEKRDLLHPIRPTRTTLGRVFYRRSAVIDLTYVERLWLPGTDPTPAAPESQPAALKKSPATRKPATL